MDPVTVTFLIEWSSLRDSGLHTQRGEVLGGFDGCFMGPTSPESFQALKSILASTDRVSITISPLPPSPDFGLDLAAMDPVTVTFLIEWATVHLLKEVKPHEQVLGGVGGSFLGPTSLESLEALKRILNSTDRVSLTISPLPPSPEFHPDDPRPVPEFHPDRLRPMQSPHTQN